MHLSQVSSTLIAFPRVAASDTGTLLSEQAHPDTPAPDPSTSGASSPFLHVGAQGPRIILCKRAQHLGKEAPLRIGQAMFSVMDTNSTLFRRSWDTVSKVTFRFRGHLSRVWTTTTSNWSAVASCNSSRKTSRRYLSFWRWYISMALSRKMAFLSCSVRSSRRQMCWMLSGYSLSQ